MFRFIALILFTFSPITCLAVDFPLKYVIEMTGAGVEFRLENNGQESIPVHDFAFTDPVGTGHWIFLYDSIEKKLYTPGESVLLPPSGSIRSIQSEQLIQLKSGAVIEFNASKQKILSYYDIEPKCYLLVGVYRQRVRERLIRSAPSNVLRICVER